MAYIDRLRQVTSNETDTYFEDDVLLYYLNKAKQQVVSYGLIQERGGKSSLRVLDGLRKLLDQNTSGMGLSLVNGYYTGTFNIPSDLEHIDYLEYNNTTPLKEITPNRIFLIKQANAQPSSIEGYYTVINDGTDRQFQIYIHEDKDKNIRVYYFKKPTALISTSETLGDIPDRLENAVVYKAAVLMLMQEIEAGAEQIQPFNQIYAQELESNLY